MDPGIELRDREEPVIVRTKKLFKFKQLKPISVQTYEYNFLQIGEQQSSMDLFISYFKNTFNNKTFVCHFNTSAHIMFPRI